MIFSSTPADTTPWYHRDATPETQHTATRHCAHAPAGSGSRSGAAGSGSPCLPIYAPRPMHRERVHAPNPVLLEVRWGNHSVAEWHELLEADVAFERVADGPHREHAAKVLARWAAVFGDRGVSTPRGVPARP